jgi:hypothetical protein
VLSESLAEGVQGTAAPSSILKGNNVNDHCF